MIQAADLEKDCNSFTVCPRRMGNNSPVFFSGTAVLRRLRFFFFFFLYKRNKYDDHPSQGLSGVLEVQFEYNDRCVSLVVSVSLVYKATFSSSHEHVQQEIYFDL